MPIVTEYLQKDAVGNMHYIHQAPLTWVFQELTKGQFSFLLFASILRSNDRRAINKQTTKQHEKSVIYTIEILEAFDRAEEVSGPRPELYQMSINVNRNKAKSIISKWTKSTIIERLTGVLARLCSYVSCFAHWDTAALLGRSGLYKVRNEKMHFRQYH